MVWPLPALGPHLPPNALSPFPFPLSLTRPKLVPASRSLHSPFPLPVSFFPSPLAYFHLSVLSGLYLNVTSPEKFSLIIPGSHQSFPYDHPILLDIATAVATPDIILFIHVLPCLLCTGGKPRSRWQSRRMSAQLLLQERQNYNSLLNNCQQENVGSHQKKIPHIQGQRRSPRKTVGGEKSHLESNAIPTRDAWRAQTNLVCTRTQGPHRD